MEKTHSNIDAPTPLWRWILAAAVLTISVVITLRFHVLGRGYDMLIAYPVGLAAMLVFAVIGFWAAMSVLHRPIGSRRLALLNLAAVFAAGDAVHTFVYDLSVGGATIRAIVHLLLVALLFPLRPAHVVFIGAITFLIMIVASSIVQETWYEWF